MYTEKLQLLGMDEKDIKNTFTEEIILECVFVCLFVLSFQGCTPHMEVPRLGVEWELQLPAYATAVWDLSCVVIYTVHHCSLQRQIFNPLSEAWD